MTKLPRNISGQELVKLLKKRGFYISRQRGSHIILCRDDPFTRVVIPDHKVIKVGTLNSILHSTGLTVEELIQLR